MLPEPLAEVVVVCNAQGSQTVNTECRVGVFVFILTELSIALGRGCFTVGDVLVGIVSKHVALCVVRRSITLIHSFDTRREVLACCRDVLRALYRVVAELLVPSQLRFAAVDARASVSVANL